MKVNGTQTKIIFVEFMVEFENSNKISFSINKDG